MLAKEKPVHNPLQRLYKIVILLLAGFWFVHPLGADESSGGLVDSQTFLQKNSTPAGPAAGNFLGAVEKLLGQMTLKEKVGQMTQLEIGMVTDGMGPDIGINPAKLHKAVVEYGVGSILNVNDQALTLQHWQETIRAIQEEA